METFFIEMTDTFAGEANYCWVHRFKVTAKNERGALIKLARETGMRFRKSWDSGDTARYNARGACVCVFVSWFDADQYAKYSLKTL